MPDVNHEALVRRVRSQYGTLIAVETAWQVTNEVAWLLRNEGCGLLGKTPGQTQVNGTSVDCLRYLDGDCFDILGSATGEPGQLVPATPQWFRTAPSGWWVAPKDPDLVDGPDPTPEPPPDDLEARVEALEMQVKALDGRVKRAGDILAGR